MDDDTKGAGTLPTLDLQPADEVAVQTPIEVTGTLTKTQILFFMGQAIAAIGGAVTFLGFGEHTWIREAVRFLSANEAVPFLTAAAWAISTGLLWFRARQKKIERAVFAYMVSNKVGKLTGKVDPAVSKAIAAAVAARSAR
jgi:hypothetical protein